MIARDPLFLTQAMHAAAKRAREQLALADAAVGGGMRVVRQTRRLSALSALLALLQGLQQAAKLQRAVRCGRSSTRAAVLWRALAQRAPAGCRGRRLRTPGTPPPHSLLHRSEQSLCPACRAAQEEGEFAEAIWLCAQCTELLEGLGPGVAAAQQVRQWRRLLSTEPRMPCRCAGHGQLHRAHRATRNDAMAQCYEQMLASTEVLYAETTARLDGALAAVCADFRPGHYAKVPGDGGGAVLPSLHCTATPCHALQPSAAPSHHGMLRCVTVRHTQVLEGYVFLGGGPGLGANVRAAFVDAIGGAVAKVARGVVLTRRGLEERAAVATTLQARSWPCLFRHAHACLERCVLQRLDRQRYSTGWG